jgi:hypothetical protein
MVGVRLAVRSYLVFWIGRGLANSRRIGRLQTRGYSLLVQVRTSGERQQTRLLVLPSKSASAIVARRLQHRYLDELPSDSAARLHPLVVGDPCQRIAINRLHEAVAEYAQ